MEKLDYENIFGRVELDKQMQEIANDFPKNEDDVLLYVRGKISTKEIFIVSASAVEPMRDIIVNLMLQNEHIFEILTNSVNCANQIKLKAND
jgi:hypothetical protein